MCRARNARKCPFFPLVPRTLLPAPQRHPAGAGSAAILRSMPANSRRIRCPSASSNQ